MAMEEAGAYPALFASTHRDGCRRNLGQSNALAAKCPMPRGSDSDTGHLALLDAPATLDEDEPMS
jgi:hypothetical protein